MQHPSLIAIIPVLPSSDIKRDIDWYNDKAGFETNFFDSTYALLHRENLYLHLQWHAGTQDDPILGGSVIRIVVKSIYPVFEEFILRGTVTQDILQVNTPWKTNEFAFYDLNKNNITFMEDIVI